MTDTSALKKPEWDETDLVLVVKETPKQPGDSDDSDGSLGFMFYNILPENKKAFMYIRAALLVLLNKPDVIFEAYGQLINEVALEGIDPELAKKVNSEPGNA